EAIPLLEGLAEKMAARFGPYHRETVITRGSLADAYLRAGRLDQSLPLFERNLPAMIARFGPDDLGTLNLQAKLGVNYRDVGRAPDGARRMEDARRRARVRSDAAKTLEWVPSQLATAYEACGQTAKAETLYRDFSERARVRFGPDDPRTAGALATLGK